MVKYTIPWYLKIGAKIVLSRVPASYRIWRRLNLFSHGAMHKPDYALKIFQSHFRKSEFNNKNSGFVCLEIGPGDSLFSAVIAKAYKACQTYLVDAGDFACADISDYRALDKFLTEHGLGNQETTGINNVTSLMKVCRGLYMTGGIDSLRKIPSGTVDFIWSQAVLEHISRREFFDTMRETRRIMSVGGICSHTIDLKDHLSGGLNNLRFSSDIWEGDLFSKSGFYTNRLRFSEMKAMFIDAGFSVDITSIKRWDSIPLPRKLLAHEFRCFSEEDLLINEFDVLLRPN